MASKQTSSPAPPPQPPNASSKLPKFLQRNGRDRSRSVSETPPIASSSSSGEMPATPAKGRRASRFLPRRDRDEEAAVVVEPIAIPRQAAEPSSSRSIGDIPSRLSGWFSHTFNSSTTDLNLSTIMAQPSPKSKASALLAVAKHGKAHVDKAMRYLLDSDATPDRCTDPIWLLGVQHPGYEPSSPTPPPYATSRGKRVTSPPSSYRSSTSSVASSSTDLSNTHLSPSASQQQRQQPQTNPAAHWPPVFYIDFISRIWLTYRSQFPQPIKDSTLTGLCASSPPSGGYESVPASTTSPPASSPSKSRWHWGGERTWSSDTGWGCMLRTGQSLLANALIHAHLGRDWRKPPYPIYTSDYATYVQILTWFFDTPSPEAPFSVHRMALAGKELGTDVGQWFGPSVAAGAVKRLVNQFPRSGLGVSVAKDGVLSQTDVFLASHSDSSTTARTHSKSSSSTSNSHQALHWGDRPVLVLVGLRLGIDGVNPIYYETIKTLFTFPQSVGIAGGRPSSSYYFVGSQADNLFYLDPHHARPAIPLRNAASGMTMGSVLDISSQASQWQPSQEKDTLSVPTEPLKRDRSWSGGNRLMTRKARHAKSTTGNSPPSSYHPPPQQESVSSTSPTSASPLSGTTSPRHAPTSPSRQRHLSPDEGDSISELGEQQRQQHGPIPISVVLSTSSTSTTNTLPSVQSNSASVSGGGKGGLDPLQEHYVASYSNAELKTFHCERVRKMPLSGLDPSMLLGFLCRDVREWEELRKGVEDLPKSIFSIQNEHPNWQQEDYDDESMMGLESMSDPEEELEVEEEDEDEEEGEGKEEEEEEDDDLELDMELGEESQVRKKKGKKVKALRKGEEVDHRDAKVEPENPHDSDEIEDEEDEDEEDEDEDEYYEPPSLISHSTSTSTSTTTTTTTTTTSTNITTTEEEEIETEEDPVEALTPGPNNTRFEVRSRGGEDGGIIPAGSADSSESGHHHHHHHRHHHQHVVVVHAGGKGRDRAREGGGRKKGKQPVGRDEEEEEEEEESDIEDGWFGIGDDVDEDEEEEEENERPLRRERHESVGTPLAGSEMTIGGTVVTPPVATSRSPHTTTTTTKSETKDKSSSSARSKSKSKSVASSSSSPPSKSKSSSHTKAKSDPDHSQKRRKEKKKAVPVPVVSIPVSRSRSATTPTTSSTAAVAATYPFPGSGSDDGDFEDGMVEVVDGSGFASLQQQQQQQQVWRESGSGKGPGTRSWERGRYESQSWAGVGTTTTSGSSSSAGGADTSMSNAAATGGLRMFKGKGRDGGRTQSGGVKGILTDRS